MLPFVRYRMDKPSVLVILAAEDWQRGNYVPSVTMYSTCIVLHLALKTKQVQPNKRSQ